MFEGEDQVLGAAGDLGETVADDLIDAGGDRVAELAFADREISDPGACEVGLDAAAGGLDLGEFGHGSGKDVADGGDYVAGAASNHEEMPDGVVVAQPVPGVEDDAQGVAEATGDEPGDACGAHCADQRTDRKDGEPTHQDIESGGPPGVAFFAHAGLKDDSGDREKPDAAEQRPAPRAAQGDEGERGVGTGDE